MLNKKNTFIYKILEYNYVTMLNRIRNSFLESLNTFFLSRIEKGTPTFAPGYRGHISTTNVMDYFVLGLK